MEEKKKMDNHNIIMENRKKITISGVIDIHSFDDELVLIETETEGILTIKGSDLKMNKLNLDMNELIVEGKILALAYSEDEMKKKTNMLNKLFK